MVVFLRPAVPADAAAVAEVHVRSWQVAYAGVVPDGVLAALDVAVRTAAWVRQLQPGPAAVRTVVAEQDGRVLGFAATGPGRDADSHGEGELYALYVHPDSWGNGVGRALMTRALADLAGPATLWVLARNDRARGFYAATGWAPDGTSRQDRRDGYVLDEVRYRRAA